MVRRRRRCGRTRRFRSRRHRRLHVAKTFSFSTPAKYMISDAITVRARLFQPEGRGPREIYVGGRTLSSRPGDLGEGSAPEVAWTSQRRRIAAPGAPGQRPASPDVARGFLRRRRPEFFLFSIYYVDRGPGWPIEWRTSKGVHFPPSESTPQTRTEGKRVRRPAGPKENYSGKRNGQMV